MLFNTIECEDIEIMHRIQNREIICAFHDIDGTHSLIRNWPPVMSCVLHDVIVNGIHDDIESTDNINRLVSLCGENLYAETDRFCMESAGLSALTQMEWAIRRHEENVHGIFDSAENSEIIRRIWNGEEKFNTIHESKLYCVFLHENTPRLFRTYEAVLNLYCRNRNLAEAKKNPEKFLVPGSKRFMQFLYENGVKNYFVTGAVVDPFMHPPTGMYEEVLALGYEIGHGKTVEDIIGSAWNEKIPKDEVMKRLSHELHMNPSQILVIGDGRSEISAGVEMGAVTCSVLPVAAQRQRELHKKIGTDMIVSDFSSETIFRMFSAQ